MIHINMSRLRQFGADENSCKCYFRTSKYSTNEVLFFKCPRKYSTIRQYTFLPPFTLSLICAIFSHIYLGFHYFEQL